MTSMKDRIHKTKDVLGGYLCLIPSAVVTQGQVEQAVLEAGVALGAAAFTRERAQGNLRRGHRILVYGFDVLMLKQHAQQAAEWAKS